ncbi:MAG: cytochrome c [Acidimicrobiia bacterium]
MRLVSLLAVVLAILAAACGGGAADLSPLAAEGATLVRTEGCAACHGERGQGGVGPAWVGLHGSEVELADGSVVVADDEYLTRAITDPGAEQVAGYQVVMPGNDLDGDQVAAIVAYLKTLR